MFNPQSFCPLTAHFAKAIGTTALTALSLVSVAQAAPSFDCRAVALAAERTVCNTPSIHALDRDLDNLYRDTIGQARRVSDARAVDIVRTAQRQFLASRNSCGTDADCIKITYRGQSSILRSYLRQLD
jgi:uncharacterized protein